MDIFSALGGFLIGLAVFVFAIFRYRRRDRDAKKKKEAEMEAKIEIETHTQNIEATTLKDNYKEALKEDLGNIRMFGGEFESKSVRLDQSFISLRMSETWRCETRFDKRSRENIPVQPGAENYLSPAKVMARAFQKCRLLLIIGDPGSGKTTLLKHYAMTCLENKHAVLGFKEKEILPLYFPLREVEFSDGDPVSLQDNLASWSKKRHLNISSDNFASRLREGNTLVLLDGLDEISDKEKRKKVCRWVKHAWTGLTKAHFVLTSRPTGYRKIDGLELECEHVRADILDFSLQQQKRFLNRWFRAVYRKELPVDATIDQLERKEKEAGDRATAIIDFLENDDNKGVLELARVPMLLQIMAILWKDREYLPG
ncbi:MAG: NACHT domain-containing protein, partial [bacterium]|nr:NACHT domain-containing protein [bacterium]